MEPVTGLPRRLGLAAGLNRVGLSGDRGRLGFYLLLDQPFGC